MTVTINGATGIAGVNGSAALPAVQGNDTNTGVFYPAADTVAISTGGTERMRVTSTGVALNGSTSGSVTLAAPAVAGTNTLTLPAVTDTLVGLAATQTLTGKTLTSPTITGAVVSSMGSSVLTSATAQASTSGTSIDFTGIPSWVKRITVMFSGVSTSGTSDMLIRLGTGATPTYATTGYVSGANTPAGTIFSSTAGLAILGATGAANLYSGQIIISSFNGLTYVSSSGLTNGNGSQSGSGAVTLSSVATAVRITTVGGTDTFDAGTINIMYE